MFDIPTQAQARGRPANRSWAQQTPDPSPTREAQERGRQMMQSDAFCRTPTDSPVGRVPMDNQRGLKLEQTMAMPYNPYGAYTMEEETATPRGNAPNCRWVSTAVGPNHMQQQQGEEKSVPAKASTMLCLQAAVPSPPPQAPQAQQRQQQMAPTAPPPSAVHLNLSMLVENSSNKIPAGHAGYTGASAGKARAPGAGCFTADHKLTGKQAISLFDITGAPTLGANGGGYQSNSPVVAGARNSQAAPTPFVNQQQPPQQQHQAPQQQVEPVVSSCVSLGSVGHPQTCAEACKYARKSKGCKDGAMCKRCHLCKWNRYAASHNSSSMAGMAARAEKKEWGAGGKR